MAQSRRRGGGDLARLSLESGYIHHRKAPPIDDKLCRLVSEFGGVCERRKLRVNVDKSKVIRCSRYGNRGRIHVLLNGEPLEEVDCFKYLGSQVAAGVGCERDVLHRMNEGYRAWGALKSVLSN